MTANVSRAQAINGYLLDLDGTVYLGDRLLAGADEAIHTLRERGRRIVFVTNKPLFSRKDYANKLTSLGIAARDDEVITSSFVLGRYLATHASSSKVFVIGERPLQEELLAADLTLCDDPEHIDVVVAAFDRTLDYGKLNTAFQALRRGARFVATNPDQTCPIDGGEIPDAAAVLGALQATTGRVPEEIVGKPSSHMIAVALDQLNLPPHACAMVGDRLETDIAMASENGLLGILTLTGVTSREHVKGSSLQPDYVINGIQDLPDLDRRIGARLEEGRKRATARHPADRTKKEDSKSGGYIGAIDAGTSSVRFVIYDSDARPIASSQRPLGLSTPRPGWVEQDAVEIVSSVGDVISAALQEAGITGHDLLGIGLANQRETVVAWDPSTGKPLYPAIVWQDQRTASRCRELIHDGYATEIRDCTGLPVDPYFSSTKMAWLLNEWAGASSGANRAKVYLGTIDSWLLWNLTGEFVTDETNASRTQLFDLQRRVWSPEMLDLFEIPSSALPQVIPSLSLIGRTLPRWFDGARIPVGGVIGDQQAALLGQARTRAGETQVTWGTGAFLIMNTGSACVPSSKLLTTIALSTSDGEVSYGLEGSVFVAGAAFRWLTDKLGILPSEDDVEAMARSVDSTEGVIFVPALTGLGSPHWDPRARGLLIGMTRATHSAHIIRAALESVAYQTRDVIDAMRSEGTWSMEELRVGGGAANNDLLCQFQSDILGLPVVRPESVETTSLGAAFAAGLSIGLWNDIEQVRSLVRSGKRFQPSISEASRAQSLSKWERALGRSRDWLAEEVEEE